MLTREALSLEIKPFSQRSAHIPLLAVGGVDLTNLEEYAKAGVVGFGIGGNIIDKKLLEAEDYPAITKLAEKYVSKVRELF